MIWSTISDLNSQPTKLCMCTVSFDDKPRGHEPFWETAVNSKEKEEANNKKFLQKS